MIVVGWMELDSPHVRKAAHFSALFDFVIFNERKNNTPLEGVMANSGFILGVEKKNGNMNVPLCPLEVRYLGAVPSMECSDGYPPRAIST